MAKSRTSIRLLVATLILLLPPIWGWWAVKGQGPLTADATVLVRKGATLDEMARQLERDGVVRSAGLFKLWARARKLQLIRGEYAFQPGTSMAEVTRKLKKGEVHWTNVVVVEGIWPNRHFENGIGINALTSAEPGWPNGGAAFHDTAVWVRREA